MSDPWTVRPAVALDLDACARLITAYEGGRVEDWHDDLAGALTAPRQQLVVAVLDCAVVGYGRVRYLGDGATTADPPLPDGYFLAGLVVADEHRRQGIGFGLCEARVAWVGERSPDVWFFTNRRNEASRSLHRRAGFREVSSFTSPRLDGHQGVLGHRPAAS